MLSHSGEECSICLEVRSLERFPTLFWRWVDYRAIPVILRNAAALLSCNNPAVLHHPFVQNWRGKKRESSRWRWTGLLDTHDWHVYRGGRQASECVREWEDKIEAPTLSRMHMHQKNPQQAKSVVFLFITPVKAPVRLFQSTQGCRHLSRTLYPEFTTDSRCGRNCLLPLAHFSIVHLICGGQISTLGCVGPNRTLQEVIMFFFSC